MRAVSDDAALARRRESTRSARDRERGSSAAASRRSRRLYASALWRETPNRFSLISALFASRLLGGVATRTARSRDGSSSAFRRECRRLFDSRWKPAVGFALLVLTLLVWRAGNLGRKPYGLMLAITFAPFAHADF